MLIRFFKKGETSVNAYLEFRRKTIEAKTTDNITANAGSCDTYGVGQSCAVFAMLCDYNLSSDREGEKYSSLACFANGTTELFYSKSGLKAAAVQQKDEIKKACLSLLKSTENALALFKKTEDFFLPEKENARIYAVTEKGVFMVEYNLEFIWAHDENLAKIRKLSDNIISLIQGNNTIERETLAAMK